MVMFLHTVTAHLVFNFSLRIRIRYYQEGDQALEHHGEYIMHTCVILVNLCLHL